MSRIKRRYKTVWKTTIQKRDYKPTYNEGSMQL